MPLVNHDQINTSTCVYKAQTPGFKIIHIDTDIIWRHETDSDEMLVHAQRVVGAIYFETLDTTRISGFDCFSSYYDTYGLNENAQRFLFRKQTTGCAKNWFFAYWAISNNRPS